MSLATGEENLLKCRSRVAFSIKGELAVPNGTTLKRYVTSSPDGLVMSENHRKHG